MRDDMMVREICGGMLGENAALRYAVNIQTQPSASIAIHAMNYTTMSIYSPYLFPMIRRMSRGTLVIGA